jgi:hypothetical protein
MRTFWRCSLFLPVVTCLLFAAPRSRAQVQVEVYPGANIQALVDRYSSGTVFLIQPGLYRNQTIVPKNWDSFVGLQGAILSGATVITGFKFVSPFWEAVIPLVETDPKGGCIEGHPLCGYPEELYFDGKRFQRVPLREFLGSGRFCLGYTTKTTATIFMVNNPVGHTVEITTTRHAFYGSARNVMIKGLIIEKYANHAQSGAIHAQQDPGPASQGWIIEQNEVRYNHGTGIWSGLASHILNNKVHHNGQMGIEADYNNVLVQGNEISYNNQAGYKWGWGAGGAGFHFTQNLIVRSNYVHDNMGPGLHTDGDNYYVTYEYNRTANNVMAGIFHEISFNAVIRYNTIDNDGFSSRGSSLWWGAGILILASSNVEIHDNTVTNSMNGIGIQQTSRGSSTSGVPYLAKNISVHNNVITQRTGAAAGIVKGQTFDNSIFTSWNNHFQSNKYELNDLDGNYYFWINQPMNPGSWKYYKNDTQGTWCQIPCK